jgi:hypothetical protein
MPWEGKNLEPWSLCTWAPVQAASTLARKMCFLHVMLGSATSHANVCKLYANRISDLDERNQKPDTSGSHVKGDQAAAPSGP